MHGAVDGIAMKLFEILFFVYMYCLMKMDKGFRAINLTYMIAVNLFISRGKHYFKGEVTKY